MRRCFYLLIFIYEHSGNNNFGKVLKLWSAIKGTNFHNTEASTLMFYATLLETTHEIKYSNFFYHLLLNPRSLKKLQQEFWVKPQIQTYWQTPQAPNLVEAKEVLISHPTGWTVCDYMSHKFHMAFYAQIHLYY